MAFSDVLKVKLKISKNKLVPKFSGSLSITAFYFD